MDIKDSHCSDLSKWIACMHWDVFPTILKNFFLQIAKKIVFKKQYASLGIVKTWRHQNSAKQVYW